jgi:hypothetical protein
MGVIIPNGFGQVSQEFIIDGGDHPFMVVTGHVIAPAGTVQGLADDIKGAWQGQVFLNTTRGSNLRLGKTRALLRNASGQLEAAENTTIVTGTQTPGAYPPPNVAVLVRKRTSFAGRQFRGRMYLPGFFLNEANIGSTGIIDAAAVTAIQGWMTSWLSTVNASNYALRLLHESGVVPPTAVTSLTAESTVATQRRRLRG